MLQWTSLHRYLKYLSNNLLKINPKEWNFDKHANLKFCYTVPDCSSVSCGGDSDWVI